MTPKRPIRASLIRAPLFRLGYFAWLVVPAALYTGYLQIGLPHLVFSYTYTAPPGRHYDPEAFHLRIYHRCRYWGPYGFVDTDAPNDWCPTVQFIKREAAQ